MRTIASDGSKRLAKYVADLRTFPRDAGLGWRQERWRGLWIEIRDRTWYRCFRRGRFLLIQKGLEVTRPVPPPDGVEIRIVAEDDWPGLAEIVSSRKLLGLRRASARGRLGMVAWRGGRAVGYTWWSERIDPDIETYPLSLPSGAIYVWNLYVVPAERGRRVGPALSSARIAYVRERGFGLEWALIKPENVAALRTARRTTATTRDLVLGELEHRKVLARSSTSYVPYEPPLPLGPLPGSGAPQ